MSTSTQNVSKRKRKMIGPAWLEQLEQGNTKCLRGGVDCRDAESICCRPANLAVIFGLVDFSYSFKNSFQVFCRDAYESLCIVTELGKGEFRFVVWKTLRL